MDTIPEVHAVVSCRYRQLLYGTKSMGNFGAEFLTILPAYLEPRACAANNARPLRMLGHWLVFSFQTTPSSSIVDAGADYG
jgi:hypothetical protein